MKGLPIVGISMGDPAGIGPEIIAKAFNDKMLQNESNPIVIGDKETMEKAKKIVGANFTIKCITNVDEADFSKDFLYVYQLEGLDLERVQFGEVSKEAGNAAFHAVKKVIELAMDGEIAATVTGPINKKAMNEAGHHFNGHTEIYGEFTGTKNYTMMLAHENLRVVHVSTHVPLRVACDLVKKERVLNVIKLAHETMRAYGIEAPRIAVAGLNPHASEDGLFGYEEEQEIIPAIKEAENLGYNVVGPEPPDTVFSKANGGFYDIVVAMYHDQGHIPLKVTGFIWHEETQTWNSVAGVNITLGLPIIRTSVDHGTAFDQAGKGTATAESLINAVQYAVKLAAANKVTVHAEI